MNEDTEKLRILIYNSNLSPRNDQYCFYVQLNKAGKPLNGLGDIDNIIQEKLSARERQYELNRLKEELEETKKQLDESEEYAEDLERQLEDAKSTKYKLGKLDLLDLGTLVLGKFAEKNADVLSRVGWKGWLVIIRKKLQQLKRKKHKPAFRKRQKQVRK